MHTTYTDGGSSGHLPSFPRASIASGKFLSVVDYVFFILLRYFSALHYRPFNWHTFKKRVAYGVPILKWLPKYRLTFFWGDLLAGITVGVMLVPQCLSYSILSDLPPAYGFFSAFVPALVYCIMGGSRHLSVGPEALINILIGAAIKNFFGDEIIKTTEQERATYACMLCLMVGLITTTLGVFRLGFMDSVLSRALLRGLVLAVATIITIEQLAALFGLATPPSSFSSFEKLVYAIENLPKLHLLTTVISLTSFAALLIFYYYKVTYPRKAVFRFTPSIVIVVIITTILTWKYEWDKQGVSVLGKIEGGFIPPMVPRLTTNLFFRSMESALLISVIGFVQSILICKTYSAIHNYPVSANRELIALGAANCIGSFFGSYPTFGSLTRGTVCDGAGAKTSITGFIAAMLIMATILFLLPAFYFVPRGVMAASILIAAVSLFKLDDLLFYWKIRAYKDLALMFLTFLTTIVFGAEDGIIISISVSLLLVVKQSTLSRISILGRMSGTDKFVDIQEFPSAETIDGILIVKIEEALYFTNTTQTKDLLRRVEQLGNVEVHAWEDAIIPLPPITAIIFDVRNMASIDARLVFEDFPPMYRPICI